MEHSQSFRLSWELSNCIVRFGLAFAFVNSILADPVSLYVPDTSLPLSAYIAGVTRDVTTYLLGCNASASAIGPCDFTAPITLIEGPSTYHIEITKVLSNGTQTATLDCPSGTVSQWCSVTVLNISDWARTIHGSFDTTSFSTLEAIQTVASPQALLYNGIHLPMSSTAVGTTTVGAGDVVTILITSTESSSATGSPTPSSSQGSTSKPTNHAWIAGAVLGPLALLLAAIGGLLLYRKKAKKTMRAENTGVEMYHKPELHGDSLVRPPIQPSDEVKDIIRSELPARESVISELG